MLFPALQVENKGVLVTVAHPGDILTDRQGWGENGMWGNLHHFNPPPTFVVLICFARSEVLHAL